MNRKRIIRELCILLKHGPDVLRPFRVFRLLVESQPLRRFFSGPRWPRTRIPGASFASASASPCAHRGSCPNSLRFIPPWLLWSSRWIVFRIHKCPLFIRVKHERGCDSKLVVVLSAIPHLIEVVFFPLTKDNVVRVLYVICKSTPCSLRKIFCEVLECSMG